MAELVAAAVLGAVFGAFTVFAWMSDRPVRAVDEPSEHGPFIS